MQEQRVDSWSDLTVARQHHGGQDYPGRAEEIAIEWECPTPELLAARDPAVLDLLTDPRLSMPRTLPDGVYAPSPRR